MRTRRRSRRPRASSCPATCARRCSSPSGLEVTDTRAFLRSRVARAGHPQSLLRIGWLPSGDPPPLTPRRPLADVVEPLGLSGEDTLTDPVEQEKR